MRIGFLNNQIDNRGTGNAVFDYAHYNEEILGNESYIYTFPYGNHDQAAVQRYRRRFKNVYNVKALTSEVDALYHIKSGSNDGFNPPNSIPYLVHSVFEVDIHGEKYATVSKWMGDRFHIPFVPHIVGLPDTDSNLRDSLGIPDSAIVFGRHGGLDSFDISFVWRTINQYTYENPNVYFLFMNTTPTEITHNADQILYLDATTDPMRKRQFINTCDAMIHARSRGETFGIAVGEFALYGKPVITYAQSPEKAHITELGEFGLYYNNWEELLDILRNFQPKLLPSLYTDFTPEKVMTKFKEVFLDGFDTRDNA